MTAFTPDRLRLEELLADRAVEALDAESSAECLRLQAAHPELDEEIFDRVAALVDLAFTLPAEPMPDAIATRIERGAVGWAARRRARFEAAAAGRRRPPIAGRILPWVAVAAALLLAALAWWPRGAAAPAVEPLRARAALLDAAPDATLLAWQENELGVAGDVAWSTERQEGYLRLRGLAANDPAEFQYQLWIFDSGRRTWDAVDGGVFDVAGPDEVVLPIDAKLRVFAPRLFAVTTEPPGGVVRHDPALDPERFRIVLVAPAT